MTELAPGWYVVSEDIVFHHSVILNGSGDYHIILANGGKMSIVGNNYDEVFHTWDSYSNENSPVGLGCLYENDSKIGINLNIYGQQDGTGELYINNGTASPDGRPQDEKVGDAINVDELMINGGKVKLYTGGSRNYGINSKNLTINNGTIDASGTIHGVNSTGNIIINGGSLTAQGGTINDDCCGINCGAEISRSKPVPSTPVPQQKAATP